MTDFFAKYDTGEFYDEMFAARGEARPHYERLLQRFTELKKDEFDRKRELAALTLLRQGVTFTVYSDAQGTEPLSLALDGEALTRPAPQPGGPRK